MEHVRKIGIAAGLHLPENCFRHSYVSFQVALTGNKSQVATWAGNSVALIDKHYRRPVFAETGEHVDIGRLRPITKKIAAEWFAMTPARAAELPGDRCCPVGRPHALGRRLIEESCVKPHRDRRIGASPPATTMVESDT
jgi:hypothetical protein